MKLPDRHFPQHSRCYAATVAALTLLCHAGGAWARPVFVVVDIEGTANAPKEFGYRVSAVRGETQTRFVLDLNPAASSAFRSAQIFFHTRIKNQPSCPVKVTNSPGGRSKTIRFSIPTKDLQYCLLEVKSGALRSKDRVLNFNAYRLRLDNINAVSK